MGIIRIVYYVRGKFYTVYPKNVLHVVSYNFVKP